MKKSAHLPVHIFLIDLNADWVLKNKKKCKFHHGSFKYTNGCDLEVLVTMHVCTISE